MLIVNVFRFNEHCEYLLNLFNLVGGLFLMVLLVCSIGFVEVYLSLVQCSGVLTNQLKLLLKLQFKF